MSMGARAPAVDDDVTLVTSRGRPRERNDQDLCLTILWHPDPERIGEQAVVPRVSAARNLSRTEPLFVRDSADTGAPLEHRSISRSPMVLTPDGCGGVYIDAPTCRMPATLDGERLDQARLLSSHAVCAGVVLELGDRIILCLHHRDGAAAVAPIQGLVGCSTALNNVQRAIARVASVSGPVLIVGETGTGKELAAQAIHALSQRRSGPLVAVNMAVLSESLAAADLFGAVKGAYTGATRNRQGLFAEADGGTLFLDEVGDTPAVIQPMLLRVLESGEYRPMGGTRTLRCDVRLIAATDRDLSTTNYNQALLQRLEAFVIAMPPLRQRREDIGLLLRHFLREAGCDSTHFGQVPGRIVRQLCRYDWAGNVRQLRHTAGRMALALRSGQPLLLDELLDQPRIGPAPGAPTSPPPTSENAPTPSGYRTPASVSETEVLQALQENGWCVRDAANALGVSRGSFYALLESNPLIRRAQDIPLHELQQVLRDAPNRPDYWAAALRSPREGLRRWVKSLGLDCA